MGIFLFPCQAFVLDGESTISVVFARHSTQFTIGSARYETGVEARQSNQCNAVKSTVPDRPRLCFKSWKRYIKSKKLDLKMRSQHLEV
jgi:hypothetical protein